MLERVSNVAYDVLRLLLIGKSSKQKLSPRLLKAVALVFKIGVSSAAIYYIIGRLMEYDSTLSIGVFLRSEFDSTTGLVFTLTSVGLMIANWGIEVWKWHMLLAKEYGTKARTALKGVLSGTTFGVFTPNRTGEFIGRVLAVHGTYRIGATVLSLVNSLSQTMATLSFGIVGLLYLLETLAMPDIGWVPVRLIQSLLIVLWGTGMFLYFRVSSIEEWIPRTKFLMPIRKHLKVLRGVQGRTLNRLYLLSILRFITFIAQYLIVFAVLADEVDFFQIASLAMLTMFSSMAFSLIPIPDLLMRQSMALSYFGLFDFDLVIVTQAIFLVWCVNVAFPAIVGAAVLFTHRIFRNV